jgi:tetratricopeptide (TPR) repeat protein
MTESGDPIASLLAESDALIAVRRYADAALRAGDAAALAPLDPRPFRALSRARYGEGRFQEAAEIASEAIRLAPDTANGHLLRATALSAQARRSTGGVRTRLANQAVAAAREAIRLAPWDPNGHVGLAQALSLTGAVREAEATVQEAIRMAPNSASTWVAAGLVALEARSWAAAVAASRRALAIDPDNYAALNNLGVALRASGKRREGTEVLARAARVDPDAVTARRNLSRAGLNVVRLAILIVLIPICLITRIGFVLYLAFAVGSNILISRNPELVLRFERWAAPIALFFAKRSDPSDLKGQEPPVESGNAGWSVARSRYAISTPILRVVAIAAWAITLIVGAAVTLTDANSTVGAVALVGFAAMATWASIVTLQRRRAPR